MAGSGAEGRRPAAEADGADDHLLPAGAVRGHSGTGRHQFLEAAVGLIPKKSRVVAVLRPIWRLRPTHCRDAPRTSSRIETSTASGAGLCRDGTGPEMRGAKSARRGLEEGLSAGGNPSPAAASGGRSIADRCGLHAPLEQPQASQPPECPTRATATQRAPMPSHRA